EETIANIKTDISTDNYAQYSGSLNNNFDADRVQSEIDLQVEITQEFSRNVQDYQARKNAELVQLDEQRKAGVISEDEYASRVNAIENKKLWVNVIAGSLLAPTDGALGIATSTVAPAVSYEIGQYFKGLAENNPNGELTTSQKTAHIATHTILGAITAQTNGGNALAGALSAGGAETIAPIISTMLYGDKKPEDLTADEKQTVSTIAQLVGVISGSLNGDSSLDAYVGGTVATNAVVNNSLFKPNNTIEAKARQAIIEGDIGELELVLEEGGLLGEDLITAQRTLEAMKIVGAEDAKLLASRYGIGWFNRIHHIFTNHSGSIGNQLIQKFGSKEKAFVAIQKAVDAKMIRTAGQQEIAVVVNGVRTNVRIHVKNGVSTISTILKW
ncbi:MAG: VENN motif pre-toxin domain-containing protein, partial [Neisseriaceae bacterium]|nr:VENN motif pre-toxin domain-containing protein [Neisseriaceae bacterium]